MTDDFWYDRPKEVRNKISELHPPIVIYSMLLPTDLALRCLRHFSVPQPHVESQEPTDGQALGGKF